MTTTPCSADRPTPPVEVPVVAVFGWSRSGRIGAVVEVFVDDVRLTPTTAQVRMVSNPAKRRREQWYVFDASVPEGTLIRIRTRVGIRGAGADTDRSGEFSYIVSSSAPLRTIRVPRVGYRQYPLLRGNVLVISERSVQADIIEQLEELFWRS